MAVNERVENISNDLDAGQQSASQASRTNFSPGKATGRAGDMNWPTDYKIPTGTPAFDGEAAGPVEMNRTRVFKLGRNIICDQVLPLPTITGTRVETVEETGVTGTNTTTDTEIPVDTDGIGTGNDNIKGA